jgi:hypothetical protein
MHTSFYNFKQYVLDEKNNYSSWVKDAILRLEKADVCLALEDIDTLRDIFRMRLQEESQRYAQLASRLAEGKL